MAVSSAKLKHVNPFNTDVLIVVIVRKVTAVTEFNAVIEFIMVTEFIVFTECMLLCVMWSLMASVGAGRDMGLTLLHTWHHCQAAN